MREMHILRRGPGRHTLTHEILKPGLLQEPHSTEIILLSPRLTRKVSRPALVSLERRRSTVTVVAPHSLLDLHVLEIVINCVSIDSLVIVHNQHVLGGSHVCQQEASVEFVVEIGHCKLDIVSKLRIFAFDCFNHVSVVLLHGRVKAHDPDLGRRNVLLRQSLQQLHSQRFGSAFKDVEDDGGRCIGLAKVARVELFSHRQHFWTRLDLDRGILKKLHRFRCCWDLE
ncbi:hypothetical protein GQ600_22087 [Phytophthora cactorum]|nr:hypothetical protein GQ600_22087 [Phytophthora cactorum]